jgi:hypothetical protein
VELWNAGPGAKWDGNGPPSRFWDRIAEPGWWEQVPAAIERLRVAKYFDSPVSLRQFVYPGFVEKAATGAYDNPKPSAKRSAGPPRTDDKPPPREWDDETKAAAKRTAEAWERKRREALA